MSQKNLSFNPTTCNLQDNEGRSVSLAENHDLSQSPGSERAWPWGENEVTQFNLSDLPCRLDARRFNSTLRDLWTSATEGAEFSFRIPHPRHDIFFSDFGYVRALLPEAFLQLDPEQGGSMIQQSLGVRFEFIESEMELDPQWQNAINAKEVTYDDLSVISRQANNVIQWVNIRMKARKSNWVQASSVPLAPEMRKQLLDQMQMHLQRGDHSAANVIQDFLAKHPAKGGE